MYCERDLHQRFFTIPPIGINPDYPIAYSFASDAPAYGECSSVKFSSVFATRRSYAKLLLAKRVRFSNKLGCSKTIHLDGCSTSGLLMTTWQFCILQSIVATTQQSRFHTETLETYCEDVDLKQLTLTVGDKELLTDADLRLFSGRRYGLVGANGSGKCALPTCCVQPWLYDS